MEASSQLKVEWSFFARSESSTLQMMVQVEAPHLTFKQYSVKELAAETWRTINGSTHAPRYRSGTALGGHCNNSRGAGKLSGGKMGTSYLPERT